MNKGERELRRMLKRYPGAALEFTSRGAAVLLPSGERHQIGGGASRTLNTVTLQNVERWLKKRYGG